MPEGDTIWRSAARLRPALEGRRLVRVDLPRVVGERPRAGDVVRAVEAVGKHLVVHLESGISIDTHMRMSGSWHLYSAGERWRRPAHLMRALLVVPGWEAVCFSAPVVRTFRPGVADGPAASPTAHLGPDLCRPDADLGAVLTRVEALVDGETSVAEALLDQRVAAGIGNVYKSEVLWACGLDPFTPVARVDEALRRRLWTTAARMLRANLTTARRTTVAGAPGSLAVYGRARRPCLRCGTPVALRRHGTHARSTYWCPRCQVGPPRNPGASPERGGTVSM